MFSYQQQFDALQLTGGLENDNTQHGGVAIIDSKQSSKFAKISSVVAIVLLVGVALLYVPGSNQAQLLKSSDKKSSDSFKTICDNPNYSKTTLKTAYEMAFVALFKDTKGEKKFEASDVIVVDNDFYAVCDNSWAIDKLGEDLRPFSPENKQMGEPDRDPTTDSGFEAIFHDKEAGVFHVVRESVDLFSESKTTNEYHAIVEEVRMQDWSSTYEVERTCYSEYEFEGDSKGFEGAVGLKTRTGELYMLGLCEGNHCLEGSKGKEKGNGQIVVMRKEVEQPITIGATTYDCVWKTVRKISIPKSAHFQDYSAIAVSADFKVAITSQEESQVWIGKLGGLDADGYFDPDTAELDDSAAKVLDFPRDGDCNVVYCNVEGVHWMSDTMLVAVSDKMKKGGRQSYHCLEKDQSIHVFVLP